MGISGELIDEKTLMQFRIEIAYNAISIFMVSRVEKLMCNIFAPARSIYLAEDDLEAARH